MEQLIITVEGKSNADLLMQLMRKFNFVKSVIRKKSSDTKSGGVKVVNEPAGEYNWINPTRPATDEEFEKMISEAEAEYEAGLGMSAEEAKTLTMKKITEWKKQSPK